VINTDPHEQPDTHWVCVYLNSPVLEYFDSYGPPPPLHREIQDFITHTCIKMCVANIVSIIYINGIEAEKPFEIGSYPGKVPPYNEIITWSNGLKRLSVNLEHTKHIFVDVINSICRIVFL
jgi:hypothetical protein